jgi:hypothetical protein
VITYRSTHCRKCKVNHWPPEHRLKIRRATSLTMIGRMPANIQREGKFGNVKRGWFDINGRRLFFRSMWEANYALYLDFLVKQNQIVSWEYEPDVFIFDKIQFGTRSYRPDFKVHNPSGTVEYHEVKGWMTPKSKTQLNRMRIYHPAVKLIVIDRKSYGDIEKKRGKAIGFL